MGRWFIRQGRETCPGCGAPLIRNPAFRRNRGCENSLLTYVIAATAITTSANCSAAPSMPADLAATAEASYASVSFGRRKGGTRLVSVRPG